MNGTRVGAVACLLALAGTTAARAAPTLPLDVSAPYAAVPGGPTVTTWGRATWARRSGR